MVTPLGEAKTSMLVPPLLAIAYVLLGHVLPSIASKMVPTSLIAPLPLPRSIRVIAAVSSTAAIVRASALLADAGGGAGPLVLLCAMALAQWLLLDGSAASLALATAAAVLGPLAELPLMAAGGWEYIRPDYWPLTPLGLGPDSGAGWAGLSSLTGPCYFAVTTDAIALGRWLRGARRS